MKLHPMSKRVQIHIYLTPTEIDKVDRLALRIGMSRSKLIRTSAIKVIQNVYRQKTKGEK